MSEQNKSFREISKRLMNTVGVIMRPLSEYAGNFPISDHCSIKIYLPRPKKRSEKPHIDARQSPIGLFGDLFQINTQMISETFALYIGIGLNPRDPNDKQYKHWFLLEGDDKVIYFGNAITPEELAENGVSKVRIDCEE